MSRYSHLRSVDTQSVIARHDPLDSAAVILMLVGAFSGFVIGYLVGGLTFQYLVEALR